LRLDPGVRFWNYAAFSALFVTGAIWLVADQLKEAESGELWQAVAANTLMLHGTAAMIALVLLGALIPLHVQRSWRIGKNRISGAIMVGTNAVLVATAAALYYAGSDTLRSLAADVHIAIGLAFPLLIVTHIVLGRRTRAHDLARDLAGRDLAGRARSRPLEMPGGLRPVTFSEDPGSR
jgi:hypothetical protein